MMFLFLCVFGASGIFLNADSLLFFLLFFERVWIASPLDSILLFLFHPVYLLLIDMFIMQVLCLKITLIYFISCSPGILL